MSSHSTHLPYTQQAVSSQSQVLQQFAPYTNTWDYCGTYVGPPGFAQYPATTHQDTVPIYYQCTSNQVHEPKTQTPLVASPQSDGAQEIQVKKHKKGRAMQACEHCRIRKQRCNEGSPCSFCKEFGLDCNYRPTGHARADKTVELMLSWMAAQSEALQLLAAKMDRLSRSTATIEHQDDISPRLKPLWPVTPTEPVIATQLNSPPNSEVPSNSIPTTTPIAASPTLLVWPKVDEVLTTCGLAFEQDYLITAEERPTLQFRAQVKHETDTDLEEGADVRNNTTSPSTFKLDKRTIQALYTSFIQHLLPLQPFLPVRQVRRLIEQFVHAYGDHYRSGESSFRGEQNICHMKSLKRKHDALLHEQAPQRRGIDCSPKNAIVLLILALGETTLDTLSTEDNMHTRNKDEPSDRTPGVSYYAKAIDLMAGHMDGDDLVHAQMFLLAGLYKTQLGRLQEASSWYFMAGRVLLRLVDRHNLTREHQGRRSSSAKLRCDEQSNESGSKSREHLIVLAAWACLRFESEILSELRLPTSGLERIRPYLPLPTQPHVDATADDRLTYFESISRLADLEVVRLQTTTLSASQQLSSRESTNMWPEQLRVVIKSHITSLQEWRLSLPEPLRWNDQDPSPNCNVTAGFRRSYWDAKLTLLKPFLYYALHVLPGLRHNNTKSVPPEFHQEPRAGSEAHILAAIHVTMKKAGESEILRLAGLCIEAIKHSIVAYEGITGKVVLTNAQSITHGNFLNVLLLAAVYRDPSLRRMTSASELKLLIDQTIDFTQQYASTSPTCAVDCAMLKQIRKTLFHEPRGMILSAS